MLIFVNMHFLDQVLTTWLGQFPEYHPSQNYDIVISFHSQKKVLIYHGSLFNTQDFI